LGRSYSKPGEEVEELNPRRIVMGQLEKRLLTRRRISLIKANDEGVDIISRFLGRGIKKGNFILRCGRPSRYTWRFDSIYG